jgi:putative spermidine/putrescine transport system ATP-binding protein
VFLGNHWLFQVDTPLGTMQITHANTGLPQAGEGDEVGLCWSGEHARVVPAGAGATA